MRTIYEAPINPFDATTALLRVCKGIIAFQVKESTGCDSETALAAVERQFSQHGAEVITIGNTLDHIIAACLDVVSQDDE